MSVYGHDQPGNPAGEGARDDYFELLAIERIFEDPDQPRQFFDDQALAALKESMRSLGRTTQHVTVVANGRGDYRVESGARRLRAARELGWTHIPAIIRAEGNTAGPHDDQFTRQVADNTLRAGLRPYELCAAVGRMTSRGQPVDAISGSTGLSRRMVYNYISILEHPDLTDELRAGRPLRHVLEEVRARRLGTDAARTREVSGRAFRRIKEQALEIERVWPSLSAEQRDQLRQALVSFLADDVSTSNQGRDEGALPPEGASDGMLLDLWGGSELDAGKP